MIDTGPDQAPPRKSSPDHGGVRVGAGRPRKTDQADSYTVLAKAKAARETYRAQLAELELKAKRRELVPVAEVAETWREQVGIARNRLLAMPTRLSADLLKLRSQRAIEDHLRAALIVILEELSTDGHGPPVA